MPAEDDRSRLRVRVLRGGTVAEISEFLADLESAYDALYWLDQALISPRRAFFLEAFPLGVPLYARERTPDQILPERRLYLNRIVIESPGFLEVLGSLNPLQQIREYLKERHERKKDDLYRSVEEQRKLKLDNEILQQSITRGELDLLRKRLEIIRDFGGDERMVEQAMWSQIGPPLARLGRHQDTGLIEGPEQDD